MGLTNHSDEPDHLKILTINKVQLGFFLFICFSLTYRQRFLLSVILILFYPLSHQLSHLHQAYCAILQHQTESRILLNGYDISFPVFPEYPAVRHYQSLSTTTRPVLKDHTLCIDLFSFCSFPELSQNLIQLINQEVLHTLLSGVHYMPLHLVHMQYMIYHFLQHQL